MRLRRLAPAVILALLVAGAPAQAAAPTVTTDRAPTRILSTDGRFESINDFAVGADGRVYVADDDEVGVYEKAATGGSPTRSLDVPVHAGQQAQLVTVDADDWVTVMTTQTQTDAAGFYVFDPDGTLVREFVQDQLGLTTPVALAAVGAEVAVVDIDSNAVQVYDLRGNQTTPTRAIPGGSETTTLVSPTTIAADPAGRLYVGGYQVFDGVYVAQVSVFAPGASGASTRPQRLIAGSRTRLGSLVTDLDVDRSGSVYAAAVDLDADLEPSGARVVRLAATATGDVRPIAVLQGRRALLGDVPSVDVAPDATLRTSPYALVDGSFRGSDVVYTQRRLGPYAEPGKVSGLRVSGSTASARRTVSWRAAAVTSPDTPVTSYAVRVVCGGKTRLSKTVGASTRSATVVLGGFAKGTCTARVTARNVIGTGPAASKAFAVRR